MAGYKAFQQRMMGVNVLNDEEFVDFDARKMRYAIFRAMYEGTLYSRQHTFSPLYKHDYGLYKYTRSVYNPAYRLGEFWKNHLLGGKLDPEAGDGSTVPSCLPILTDNEQLRPFLAQIWRDSNWQIKKDVLGLWTPIEGDGIIKIEDDVKNERVYMRPISPSTLADVTLDERGNVRGYVIEELRKDPRKANSKRKVTYREVATREGDNVHYVTYLDNKPYAWDGEDSQWDEAYTFVPMVLIKHNDVGLNFGYSELLPGMSKFREVDDLASKLSDQIRKTVDAPWLLSGVTKPKTTPKVQGEEPTEENKQPGREEIPIFYGPTGADAKALVADMNIQYAAEYIKDILADIERDYPELNRDMHNVSGDISGRALRINRGPAEEKVLQRRPNYDDSLVRAQQMALSIGGMRGYFEGITLESYWAGELDHTIGDRPVFSKDVMDNLERDEKFYTVANQAKAFGIPPTEYLRLYGAEQGWDEDKIKQIEASPEYKARLAAMNAATEAAKNPSTPSTNRFTSKKNATQ